MVVREPLDFPGKEFQMQKFLDALATIMLLSAFSSLVLYFMPGTKYDLLIPAIYAILSIAVRLTKMDRYGRR